MLHDQDELTNLSSNALRGYAGDDKNNNFAALVERSARHYHEHQAAPLEARILALEEALKDSHHYHVVNLRRHEAASSPLEFNEYIKVIHAPVEPHPLLVDKS